MQQWGVIIVSIVISLMILIAGLLLGFIKKQKYMNITGHVMSAIGFSLTIYQILSPAPIIVPTSGYDVVISTPSPEQAHPEHPEFIKYESQNFNYKIEYPSHFEAHFTGKESDYTFESPDKKATLSIKARKYQGDDFPADFAFKRFLQDFGGTPTYQDTNSKDWYAIAIKTDNYYIYRKCLKDGINVRYFQLSYPLDQQEIYYSGFDYFAHIENSFTKLY